MLGTPTYHRYPPPAQMARMRKPSKMPFSEAAQAAGTTATAPTRATPKTPAGTGGVGHAEDLVARLNARLAPYNGTLYFEIAGNQAAPHVHMKQSTDQHLVRSFSGGELLELERGVYELSGFHLSVTA